MVGLMQADSGEYAIATTSVAHLPLAERQRELRGYINWVEDQLLDLEQAETDLEHQLLDGLYTRTMRIPAGCTLTGAVHKKGCLTVLIEGEISILTENGSALLTAPLLFYSAAGVRRLGHSHTPVVWATIHAVQGTSLEEIEDELFEFVVEE